MGGFVDRALLRLGDPARLAAELSTPAPDPAALRMLLSSVHDLEHVRIESISTVTVPEIGVQVPLFPALRHLGTWTRSQPSYVVTDVAMESRGGAEPVWVDVLARLRVTLVAEVDPSGVESVISKGMNDFATLDEFRERFRYIDVDDFMARHQLQTVDDLREAFEYLITEVRFRAPVPFDPAAPQNRHDVEFELAVLIESGLGLTEALRRARTVREVAAQTRGGVKDALLGRPDRPLAVAVVLDATQAQAEGLQTDDVQELFAREQVLCLFAQPN